MSEKRYEVIGRTFDRLSYAHAWASQQAYETNQNVRIYETTPGIGIFNPHNPQYPIMDVTPEEATYNETILSDLEP